jgi:glutamate-1-semialdehyde aminotransferase
VLIFDEVVTGFHISPGGPKGSTDIIPDINTLTEIVAGGLPGYDVASSSEIINCLDHNACGFLNREKIIQHSSAFEQVNDMVIRIRLGLNHVIKSKGLGWLVYGEVSGFHFYRGICVSLLQG